MRRIAAVLVFAMVTVLTAAAHALTVTEGTLLLFPMDRFAGFSGEGFAVQMSSPFGADTASAFGVPFVSLSTELFGSAVVIVGGAACVAVESSSPPCGSITLTHAGLPPLPVPPLEWLTQHPDENFIATAPFTATGHLNFPDGGFEFVGQGIVTGIPFCFVQGDQCSFGTPNLRYTFSVPEPPTLLLLISSFGVLGALFSVRFLRNGRNRSRYGRDDVGAQA